MVRKAYRLEALLLPRTLEKLQQEPTFQTVKVVPTNSPPVGTVKSSSHLTETSLSSHPPTD